jgi:hypothetical protein
MVWASARSAKIFSAVSATILSLSATAFLTQGITPHPAFLPDTARHFVAAMMGKSIRPDKHRCPQGCLRTAHARIAVLAGMIYSAQRTFSGLPDISLTIW